MPKSRKSTKSVCPCIKGGSLKKGGANFIIEGQKAMKDGKDEFVFNGKKYYKSLAKNGKLYVWKKKV